MFCNRVFVIFVWFLCSQERAYDEENKSKEESSFCSPIDSQMPALAAQSFFRGFLNFVEGKKKKIFFGGFLNFVEGKKKKIFPLGIFKFR